MPTASCPREASLSEGTAVWAETAVMPRPTQRSALGHTVGYSIYRGLQFRTYHARMSHPEEAFVKALMVDIPEQFKFYNGYSCTAVPVGQHQVTYRYSYSRTIYKFSTVQ